MKTIKIENGQEFILMPQDYYATVMQTPLGMIYKIPMYCQIQNCGYIVCHKKKNTFFDIYEPTDNEFDLEAVYAALKK